LLQVHDRKPYAATIEDIETLAAEIDLAAVKAPAVFSWLAAAGPGSGR